MTENNSNSALDYSPIELPAGANAADYAVQARGEILVTLRHLMKTSANIVAYYGHSNQSFRTLLLDIDTTKSIIIFDIARDAHVNQTVINNATLICITYFESIKTQFILKNVRKTSFNKGEAFECSIPINMLKLQRRAFYRLDMEQAYPLTCSINLPNKNIVDFKVHDLSLGGVSFTVPESRFNVFTPQLGLFLKNTQVRLPGLGVIITDLIIRSLIEVEMPDGSKAQRVGCQITRLPPMMEMILQQFITSVDRERRARIVNMMDKY